VWGGGKGRVVVDPGSSKQKGDDHREKRQRVGSLKGGRDQTVFGDSDDGVMGRHNGNQGHMGLKSANADKNSRKERQVGQRKEEGVGVKRSCNHKKELTRKKRERTYLAKYNFQCGGSIRGQKEGVHGV